MDCMDDHLLPKEQRRLKTYEKLQALKQRPNQSVESFLAHYDSIEHMMKPIPEDWFSYFMIITKWWSSWFFFFFCFLHPTVFVHNGLRLRLGVAS